MRSKVCGFIMEKIDNNPFWEKDSDIKEHLKKCPECKHYAAVTSHLNRIEENGEKVELWNEFLDKLETRGQRTFWLRPVMAAVSLIFIVSLFFTFYSFNTPQTVNQTNTVVSNSVKSGSGSSAAANAEYNYDTSDLDYYYEISMEI